jgi:hypothetical protein
MQIYLISYRNLASISLLLFIAKMTEAWETENDSDDNALEDKLDGLALAKRGISRDHRVPPWQPAGTQKASNTRAKRVEDNSILHYI